MPSMPSAPTGTPPPTAAIIGYGVGGVALLALAAVAPKSATIIVSILIATVLLAHSGQVAGVLQAGTQAIQGWTGHTGTQGSAQ